jgi:hypothetical protein
MSSTPPAAHASTLKRQRESNLDIQLRALTIKDMMCTYIETWRTKGSPLAGCFGSTSESAGGLSFSCQQNLAEFGQTKYTICPWFEALEFASSATLARNYYLEMKKRTMAHTYMLGKYSV